MRRARYPARVEELIANLIIIFIMIVVGVVVFIVKKMQGPDPNAFRFGANVIDPSRGVPNPYGPGGAPSPYGPGGAPNPYGAPGAFSRGGAQGGYGPQGGYGAPPGYGAPMGAPGQGPFGAAPPVPEFGPPSPGAYRLVVRPEQTFDRISDAMTRAGMAVTSAPGPAVMTGEPSHAVWRSDEAQVVYRFDPRTYLRAMEITGIGAGAARHSMVALAGLTAMDGAQIARLLQTPQRAEQLLGLAAAEHLGPGPEAQVFAPAVSPLAQSPDPEVATIATRLQQRLRG